MKPLRYPPINASYPHLLHGADYNPDQWQHSPEVLKEDVRLMKLAGCNTMAVGIFAWSALEPEEGRFTFDWLDRTMDDLAASGVRTVLATPSGARPAWMAQKYPEVLRLREDRTPFLYGMRHNHCMTSPVYREKCREMNTRLAERYKDHPGLLVWHVSNEYGGYCYCPKCEEAFREWLQNRYGSLETLNEAWWSSFWSHTYTDWSQIEAPSSVGEFLVHGLNLDWKRFMTDQTVDFMKKEIEPLRRITPDIPVTTNLMGFYYQLDYWKFAPELDVISWDSYPDWSGPGGDWNEAAGTAFTHDFNRSLKGGKPFMLMESTPSCVNWKEINKLKRPGQHRLASLQAIAHGADTVQYFQWRKSRGSSEKFHGAVVDHVGHEHTRVFREVAEVGDILSKLDDVVGTTVPAEVAILFDWENRWALDDAQGARKAKGYDGACHDHYRPFFRRGIPVDVVNEDSDFSTYRLLIAPMLYMVRPGTAERLTRFVENGGTLVCTYLSGIVNETDLCFLGGFPGPLRKVLGIWSEEIDSLYDGERNTIRPVTGNSLGLSGIHQARELCDLIHAEGAEVIAEYGDDFYVGRPAVTVHPYGLGRAYYVAARMDGDFNDAFLGLLADQSKIKRAIDADLPKGVSAGLRTDGTTDFIFLLNFLAENKEVDLGPAPLEDLLAGGTTQGIISLPALATKIFRRPRVV